MQDSAKLLDHILDIYKDRFLDNRQKLFNLYKLNKE